jgi:excinuclease UvrABC nuclease subunit
VQPTKEKSDLQKKVHEVPHKPGVYLMRDRFNRVIYVGKARDLRKRVSSYFLPSKLAQADLKTRAMLDATWGFETHTVRSEGIPTALQYLLSRRQAVSRGESRSVGTVAAVSPRPI